MKPVTAALAIGIVVLFGTAFGGAQPLGYVDSARVVWSEPIYETVAVSRPVRECWSERVVNRGARTGAIPRQSLPGMKSLDGAVEAVRKR